MAVKSKNPRVAIKNPDMRQYIAGQVSVNMIDSGAGILAGQICELSSGEVKTGTEQNTAFMGITRNAAAIDAPVTVEWGFVPVLTASSFALGDRLAPRASGRVGKAQAGQVSLLDATAGGNFANQPGGAAVLAKSDSAADTTQTVTLYGTITGTTTSETVAVKALNGVTAVAVGGATWQNILGVRLSAACAGTITIELAGGNDIITIAAGTLTAGIVAATSTQAYGLIPRHDGSGATTAPVGIVGTGIDGLPLSAVDTMNGATEEDHGTIPYSSVTEFHIGAVASTVNVNVLTNEASDASVYCGIAVSASTAAGQVVDAFIKPYWM